MILETVYSINGVPIRLTDERWYDHILEDHPEMSPYMDDVLATVEDPEYILRGHGGAQIAVIALGRVAYLHVMYRELKGGTDGFIITAFIKRKLDKTLIVWRRD
jgi:hypothetical protein